ncbi:glutamate carboxypeptidase [Bradyrhizobium sp. NFR13]|jgi:glutamate carboxypeptidase|uniref:M20 family metallopeptidase n=1 Tax=Bradyrhizobium sp. NFR13 TaxID=1566285 RepID=UPI0008F003CD|nr:M20 family metallopeptidase [Bradyrhizobium sp. NFR13]SFM04788.1 glutamate carboxypeptidase [Bradyrhizobium sp. NFR13]
MSKNTETQIIEWLASQQQPMIDLLRDVVNIDSGSFDKEGVDAVGARFEQHFAEYGIETWREPHDVYGDAVHGLITKPGSNEKPILLMGHRDTVFPKGEVAKRPFTIKGNLAHGPGVADMKAGVVINVFVAAALKKFDAAPCPIKLLITGDEEIASRSSRPIIEREGRAARAVYNSEPGRPTGNITTGRKGGVFMRFEVFGKAAHSGNNFAVGISAIGELAHKIVQIHALTDMDKGITLNVGLVSGGQSVNTTAPHAEGEIDFRYIEPADRATIMAAIEKIIATSTVPGTTAKLHINGEFLPLVQDAAAKAMFEAYQAAAVDSGLTTLTGEFAGGCADSGFTASVGTPTLCGLGPVGGNVHTDLEWLDIESIVPRAQTLARAILRTEI